MAFISEASAGCPSCELDLFEMPPTQISVDGASYTEYHPLSSVSDSASTIEFLVDGSGDSYVDLKNTFLCVKAKITKADGGALADDEKIAPINYFLHSMFSQADIFLNGVQVSSSTDTYAYRAIMECLLSYSDEAKKTQLTTAMFHKDEAGKMNAKTLDAAGNEGFKKRQALTKKSKNIDLIGRIHSDLFFQDRYILNNVSIRIRLIRHKESFCLIGDNAHVLKIISAQLLVRKIRVSPSVALGHAKALQIQSAKYPINRVIVKTFTIAHQLFDTTQEKLFTGQLPSRLVIGLVENEAYNGSLALNPFDFKHFNLSEISIHLDGQSDYVRPLKMNYEKGEYTEAYLSLFTGTNKIHTSEGNSISLSEYPEGYCLYAFYLTSDFSNHAHYNLIKTGNVRISLKFAKELEKAVSVICYGEFESVLQITAARNILLE